MAKTNDLQNRTKQLAIDVVKFVSSFPPSSFSFVVGKQLIRCSTSVGANYRAARRGKSLPDFINKLKIVEEETDETIYFLEIIEECYPEHKPEIEPIKQEASEILAMIVASIRTSRSKALNSI